MFLSEGVGGGRGRKDQDLDKACFYLKIKTWSCISRGGCLSRRTSSSTIEGTDENTKSVPTAARV